MNKYGAKKTEIDGVIFDSKREASRYQELKLMERVGEISDLKLQPRFLLQDKYKVKDETKKQGYSIISKIEYVADFEYIKNNRRTIEDVKGMKTDVYRLKKKLFMYRYMQKDELDFIES